MLLITFITVLALGPIGAVMIWHYLNGVKDRFQKRRDRLSRGILPPAGFGLEKQINDTAFDLISMLFLPALSGFVLVSALALPSVLWGEQIRWPTLGFTAMALLVVSAWSVMQSIRLGRRLKNLKHGRRGELDTAAELNQLMRRGYQVFHDVPAEGFNIDHLVVGPSGTYAVETKFKSKRKRAGQTNDWTATYDGKSVDLAGFRDTAALDQARRQARWVRKWLTKATGQKVIVTPALSLPGWMVKRKALGDVRVINPQEACQMVAGKQPDPLSQTRIDAIAYQVDQRCRSEVPGKQTSAAYG